jgi:hypothetical protein
MNEQIRRLVGRFGLWILLMEVIGVGGCGADKKGKFTDEQMAQFPLATRYNLPGPSGGMALNVNTETITVDEVVKLLKQSLETPAKNVSAETFRFGLGRWRGHYPGEVIDILLYQQAKQGAETSTRLSTRRWKWRSTALADSGNNYALAQASLSGRVWIGRVRDSAKIPTGAVYISQS